MRNFFTSFLRRFSKSNRPRRPVWQRLTNFWDGLFLLWEKGRRWLARFVAHGSVVSTLLLEAAGAAAMARLLSTYSVLHDHSLNVNASAGLLAGLGSGLTISSYTSPSNGFVSVGSDGSFDYSPTSAYVGTDTFGFTYTDGFTYTTDTASINVYDTALPVAVNHTYWAKHDQTLSIAGPGLLAGASEADGDTLTVSALSSPSNGFNASGGNDGSFTYTPTSGYLGTDSFTYTITDSAHHRVRYRHPRRDASTARRR